MIFMICWYQFHQVQAINVATLHAKGVNYSIRPLYTYLLTSLDSLDHSACLLICGTMSVLVCSSVVCLFSSGQSDLRGDNLRSKSRSLCVCVCLRNYISVRVLVCFCRVYINN